jgi:hypothetical protein
LNKALAHEAEDDELEMEVAAELAKHAEYVYRENTAFSPMLIND